MIPVLLRRYFAHPVSSLRDKSTLGFGNEEMRALTEIVTEIGMQDGECK